MPIHLVLPKMEVTQTVTEDDMYRASTQYRLWTFTPEALSSLRTNTHSAAIDKARSYLPSPDTPTLTLAEEVALVQRYSEQIRTTADFFHHPVNVKATAVQYLKRFYLTNSCMTYPPKEVYKTVLYLAMKTEGQHMTLPDYARKISSKGPEILAPEYKIIQALRFTLDVRQPFRGLRGALMELLNLAAGKAALLPFLAAEGATSTSLQETLTRLPPPPSGSRSTWQTGSSVADRAQEAVKAARLILDAPALLTDVYFLFTPPQIYLAALRLADEPLYSFYLSTKIPLGSPQREVILGTIAGCAEVLGAFDQRGVMTKEARAALELKLEDCRDPSTRDLVRRNEEVREEKMDEGRAEKKKGAREKNEREGDELFGPSLGR